MFGRLGEIESHPTSHFLLNVPVSQVIILVSKLSCATEVGVGPFHILRNGHCLRISDSDSAFTQ